jgi:hypothetical protein
MRDGYNVITHPKEDQLPPFGRDFGVDLVAERGDEKVLVQVKRDRSAVEADPNIPARAGITNTHPGWRYDLVVLTETDPMWRVLEKGREPTRDEIQQFINEVEVVLQAGAYKAGFLTAWAALEAAMRRVASDEELYTPRSTPAELLSTLYGNGFLPKEDFGRLRESFRVRSALVHGLPQSDVGQAEVEEVIQATRYLLTGNREAQSVAG